jgi:hypothetical protein
MDFNNKLKPTKKVQPSMVRPFSQTPTELMFDIKKIKQVGQELGYDDMEIESLIEFMYDNADATTEMAISELKSNALSMKGK